MATQLYLLASQNWWLADGTTELWNISFAGGYIDRTHVKAWMRDPTGTLTPISLTSANWLGPNQLRITPAVPSGYTLAIYRDTPKIEPLVNFTDRANLSEVSLDTNAKQAIFAAAETTDLLTLSVFDSAGVSIEALTAAAEAAVAPHINALRDDLTSAEALKGAGMVRYNPAQAGSYPSWSVGAYLASAIAGGGGGGTTLPPLEAGKWLGNNGTALLWGTPAGGGGGSVTPGIGLNLLDYIPEAEWPGLRDGSSSYDCTSAIQSWINALSNGHNMTGIVPAGRYPHTTIHCYYHASLNPGFNVKRNAKLHIKGDGTLVEHYAYGSAGSQSGTTFHCTSTAAGTGWIVSPIANDANPFLGRDFIVENIAFVGAQADYLVNIRGVPGARVIGCEFLGLGANTGGLALTTSYFGVVEKTRFRNTAATSTANALYLSVNSADAPGAGLFLGRDLNISGFKNGVFHATGGWTTVRFENSQLSSRSDGYNVFVNGPIDLMDFQTCQWEAPCRGWIKANGAGFIKNLRFHGWGLDKGTIADAAAIDLLGPSNVALSGVFQDMRKALCNVDALADTKGQYKAECSFIFYESSGTMRTMFTGRPPSEQRSSTGGAANARLFAPGTAKPMVVTSTGPGGGSYNATNLMVGTLNTSHVVGVFPTTAPEYYHSLLGYAGAVALNPTAPVDLLLDGGTTAGLGDGFNCQVFNKGSATITVKNALGGGTIGTVPAGQNRLFLWAADLGMWL